MWNLGNAHAMWMNTCSGWGIICNIGINIVVKLESLCILVRFPLLWWITMTKSNVRRKQFISAYGSTSQSITKGRKLEARTEAEGMGNCCLLGYSLLACSYHFLMEPMTTRPGHQHPHGARNYDINPCLRKYTVDLATEKFLFNLKGHFLNWEFPHPND